MIIRQVSRVKEVPARHKGQGVIGVISEASLRVVGGEVPVRGGDASLDGEEEETGGYQELL